MVLHTSWGGLQSRRKERVDSCLLRELLLWLAERILKACGLLLNRRKLLRSRVCKRTSSTVHELLLLHTSLHRILEAILRLVLLLHPIVLEPSGRRHHSHALWAVLRRIETSELLAHPYFVQTLTRWGNLRLEPTRGLHPRALRQ